MQFLTVCSKCKLRRWAPPTRYTLTGTKYECIENSIFCFDVIFYRSNKRKPHTCLKRCAPCLNFSRVFELVQGQLDCCKVEIHNIRFYSFSSVFACVQKFFEHTILRAFVFVRIKTYGGYTVLSFWEMNILRVSERWTCQTAIHAIEVALTFDE